MTAPDWTLFDNLRAQQPDPGILEANIRELSATQPDWAGRVAAEPPPPDWIHAVALDGSPTMRWRDADGRVCWLGGTAAPRARAGGLLVATAPGNRNLLLSDIGSGLEMRVLLERLARTAALFVCCPAGGALAAILRIHDFSAALRDGRLWLLDARRPRESLASLLDRHAGLLAPAAIIGLPGADSAALAAEIAAAASHCSNQRRERLAALFVAATNEPGVRLAVAALRHGPVELSVADDVSSAASSLGWRCDTFALRTPLDADWLPHRERLAELRPNVVLSVGCAPPEALHVPGAAQLCWHVTADVDIVPQPANYTHFAATTRIAERLQRLGIACESFPFCRSPRIAGPPGEPDARTVLIVGDRASLDPQHADIRQPTHEQLWRRVVALAEQRWQADATGDAESLLRLAERELGLSIRDAGIREHFVAMIEQRVSPTAALSGLARALAAAGFNVDVCGAGWASFDSVPVRVLGDHSSRIVSLGIGRAPRAAIVLDFGESDYARAQAPAIGPTVGLGGRSVHELIRALRRGPIAPKSAPPSELATRLKAVVEAALARPR